MLLGRFPVSGPMAEKLIQQPSSITFTTEITEATEKTS